MVSQEHWASKIRLILQDSTIMSAKRSYIYLSSHPVAMIGNFASKAIFEA